MDGIDNGADHVGSTKRVTHDSVVNIIEISKVIQGEGKRSGVPSILVRLSGCPLRCQWGDNTCDSYYTSWNPSKGKYSLADFERILLENTQTPDVMITGGEPLASESVLLHLILISHRHGRYVTIETAGIKSSEVAIMADLISISPKMSNSTPKLGYSVDGGKKISQSDIDRHERTRKNQEHIRYYNSNAKDFQLKYVISNDEAVDEAMNHSRESGVNNGRIFLMPEGVRRSDLVNKRQWMMQKCIELGVNYSDRLHILAYDNLRNV